MPQSESRYDFLSVVLHWLAASAIFAQLATAWFMHGTQPDAPNRELYFGLHLIIGTISFLLIISWTGWRLTHKPPPYPKTITDAERYLALFIYFLLYLCLLLLPVSGYLQLDLGRPIDILGKPLHLWLDQDDSLAASFNYLHIGLAWLLIVLLAVHLLMAFFHLVRRTGVFSRMLLSFDSQTTELMLPGFTGPSRKYRFTSINFLVFGWLAFLFQLLIAIITVLLLAFATSGNQPAASGLSGNENSIFWAQWGIATLFITIIFFYFNTRYANKIKQQQDVVLHAHKQRIMNMLRFGLFSGYAGIVVAILGVTSSIELLISKTISQPPGIAITDPTKIVRALDVFVLVSNFSIVIAHFVGIIVSLWLLNRVDRNF